MMFLQLHDVASKLLLYM